MKKLIFISANWCSACKNFKPTMDKISQTLPVEFYDADKDHEIVLKYKIRKIPTLILIQDNNEVKQMVGNHPEEEVLNFFNN